MAVSLTVEERCDAVALAEALMSGNDLIVCSGVIAGGVCCIAASTRSNCSVGFDHNCVGTGVILVLGVPVPVGIAVLVLGRLR